MLHNRVVHFQVFIASSSSSSSRLLSDVWEFFDKNAAEKKANCRLCFKELAFHGLIPEADDEACSAVVSLSIVSVCCE